MPFAPTSNFWFYFGLGVRIIRSLYFLLVGIWIPFVLPEGGIENPMWYRFPLFLGRIFDALFTTDLGHGLLLGLSVVLCVVALMEMWEWVNLLFLRIFRDSKW